MDIVTGPLNAGLLEPLKAHFSGQQVPLLVNTMGADVVKQEAPDPYVFINSFTQWQTSWLSGYWGAAAYGQRGCSLAALHDGGYGMGFAFAVGLEAQNGTLVQVAVTHRNSRLEDPSEFIQQVAETQPDFIMGLYSGKEALSFLNAYHRLGSPSRIPLLGLPGMVDESLLSEAGQLAQGIKSISCWRRDTVADQQLAQTFAELTGHPLNSYVLMAYETGHLIARAVQQSGTNRPTGKQLADVLPMVEFQSPRGLIKFDPETREVSTSYFLREVAQGDDGEFYNQVVEELSPPPLLYEQLDLARKNIPKQGWLNPYLVA